MDREPWNGNEENPYRYKNRKHGSSWYDVKKKNFRWNEKTHIKCKNIKNVSRRECAVRCNYLSHLQNEIDVLSPLCQWLQEWWCSQLLTLSSCEQTSHLPIFVTQKHLQSCKSLSHSPEKGACSLTQWSHVVGNKILRPYCDVKHASLLPTVLHKLGSVIYHYYPVILIMQLSEDYQYTSSILLFSVLLHFIGHFFIHSKFLFKRRSTNVQVTKVEHCVGTNGQTKTARLPFEPFKCQTVRWSK